MVAYSFRPQFIAPIQSGVKQQTVRGFRKRHAREGEAIQLYTAMRTRQCRKLLTPDPVCATVQNVVFELDATLAANNWLRTIELNGIPLTRCEIDLFAFADGFGQPDRMWEARAKMGRFWIEQHGPGVFFGVLIKWKAA